MAEPQLSPEELDRVEDALEDLELGDLIDDPSPHVRTRLADFREILIASREALPMQEVPAGVLAGVLAEARAESGSSEVLGLTPVEEPAKEPESWWSRVRKGFLIPSLAVVGTAALILIIVQPMSSDGPTTADMDVVAKLEPAAEAPPKSNANMPATPAPEVLPALEEAPEDAADEDEIFEIATSRRARKVGKATTKADAAAVGGKTAGAPGAVTDEEPGKDGKESEEQAGAANWDAVEKGDKARRAGDCFTASNAYHRALDDGNDSVRARALAGLGLCATEDGNSAKASAYYKEARALDPDVGDYIATQSPERAQKPKRNVPRKKAKRKKADYDAPAEALAPNARDVQPFKD